MLQSLSTQLMYHDRTLRSKFNFRVLSASISAMDIVQKEKLALRNDMGVHACGHRVKAVRIAAGFAKQNEFATAANATKQSINNTEKGRQYPNHKVLAFLYKAHRIDFNFLMNGDFAQLPSDVQSLLFATLEALDSETSGRDLKDIGTQRPLPPIGDIEMGTAGGQQRILKKLRELHAIAVAQESDPSLSELLEMIRDSDSGDAAETKLSEQ